MEHEDARDLEMGKMKQTREQIYKRHTQTKLSNVGRNV